MAEENTMAAPARKQAARKKARSPVWGNFTRFTDVDGKDKAECKRCRQVLGADSRNGTSTLWNHVKNICKDRDGVSQAHPTSSSLSMMRQLHLSSGPGESSGCAPSRLGPAAGGGSSSHSDHDPGQKEASEHLAARPGALSVLEEPGLGLEEAEASRDLASMIAIGGYDSSFVEDNHFRSFVTRLNPGFKLPSRCKVEEMCARIFRDQDKQLSSPLSLLDQTDCGNPSFAFVKAKSLDAAEDILCLTCHFVDDQWNLHRVLMDAFRVSPPSDHYNYVPLRGMPMISHDDSDISIITEVSIGYPFMIAGEMNADFELIIKLKDELQCMHSCYLPRLGNTEIICATYMDHLLHSIAQFLLPDSEFKNEMFWFMYDLEWSKEQYQERLSPLGLCYPRDYDEHWYSFYCSLEIQIQIQGIAELDFKILLRNIFGVIYCAIKELFASTTPTSNLCLEELFKVRHVLQSQLSDACATNPAMIWDYSNKKVADVLQEALDTVDKAIQDSYMVWSIPLVLDPRYKLRHIKSIFETVFGSESETANRCTSDVTRKIKELYNGYIQVSDEETEDSDDMIEEMAIDNDNYNPTKQTRDGHCTSQDYGESELDCYMQDSPARATEDFNILKWWKSYGSVQYPTVARMARDALAMPTSSKLTCDQTAHLRSIIRRYGQGC